MRNIVANASTRRTGRGKRGVRHELSKCVDILLEKVSPEMSTHMREKVMGEGDPVTPKASLGSLWITAYLKAFRGVAEGLWEGLWVAL
jgi:hypothetical protein